MGPVIVFLRHSPLIVLPPVAIQATPLPLNWASRRCFDEPSLSAPKATTITTTFLGATRFFDDASVCFDSPVTDRGYELVLRSYL